MYFIAAFVNIDNFTFSYDFSYISRYKRLVTAVYSFYKWRAEVSTLEVYQTFIASLG